VEWEFGYLVSVLCCFAYQCHDDTPSKEGPEEVGREFFVCVGSAPLASQLGHGSMGFYDMR